MKTFKRLVLEQALRHANGFREPYMSLPVFRSGEYGDWEIVPSQVVRLEQGMQVEEHVFQPAYFRGPGNEGHYHILRDRVTKKYLRTSSMLEQECMSVHAAYCEGVVAVAGVGIGVTLKHLSDQERVTKIYVIEKDPDRVGLIREMTDFSTWPGRDKITFIIHDPLNLNGAFRPGEQINHLFCDIWDPTNSGENYEGDDIDEQEDALLDFLEVAQVAAIQKEVGATTVSWFGQELVFWEWCMFVDHGARVRMEANKFTPVVKDFDRWRLRIKLPVPSRSKTYMNFVAAAGFVVSLRTLIESLPPGADPLLDKVLGVYAVFDG